MNRLLVILFCLLLFSPAWAQSEFETAVQALKDGHDHEALAACLRLEESGQASFGSLYNQGLALRNLGDVPRARACFERALILNPHNVATRQRLREIDSELGEKVISRDVRGTPWWRAREADLLVILPGLVMLILALAARIKGVRPAATPMLSLFLGGLGLLALIVLTSPAQQRAVVVDQAAQLLPEAKPDKPGEKIPAGALVDITERSDHYVKVRLGDDKTGWLRTAQVAELTLPPPAKK